MNTTYVTVTPGGPLPCLHIRQFNADRQHDGQITINPDGVILSMDEFGTLMFHLRAIEDRLLMKTHTDLKPEPPVDVATQTSPPPIVVTVNDPVEAPILQGPTTTNIFDSEFDFQDWGLSIGPPAPTSCPNEPLTTPIVPVPPPPPPPSPPPLIKVSRKRMHQPPTTPVSTSSPSSPIAVPHKRVYQPSDHISVGIQNKKQKQYVKVTLWYAKRIRQHCIQLGANDCF